MTDLKISYEFNQSGKKQPGKNYVMNFGYGSHTSQSMCTFVRPKSKQNNLKMNVNTIRKKRNYSQVARSKGGRREGGGGELGAVKLLRKILH